MTKIMLVEDDRTMLNLLTTLLTLEGYAVISLDEDSEDEIAEAICTRQPDMVLMDVHLRHADGLAVLRKVRGQSGCARIRFLMSSGFDYRQDCLENGADGFILKPYMPDDLLRQLRSLLAIKEN